MTNLDSILKSRHITLPAKVHLVKATVCAVVMYRCESWTIKKAECQITDAFKLCWRRLLRAPWTTRGSNQSNLKEINPEYSLEGLMLNLQYFGHLMQRAAAAAAAKSLHSCLTLCDPMDGSPPGSPVSGILQARTLEWVAISFSNAGKWKVKVKSLSCVRPSATAWNAAYQPLRPWDFPGRSTGVGCHCLLRN